MTDRILALPVLPLRNLVLFPGVVLPVDIGRPGSLKLIEDVVIEELAADIALAKDANLDLVRVHGHISRHELYDAADEAGMVVWQDFPLQWSYARSIRKQAQRQAREAVDLLGHHPSVAIWCDHN